MDIIFSWWSCPYLPLSCPRKLSHDSQRCSGYYCFNDIHGNLQELNLTFTDMTNWKDNCNFSQTNFGIEEFFWKNSRPSLKSNWDILWIWEHFDGGYLSILQIFFSNENILDFKIHRLRLEVFFSTPPPLESSFCQAQFQLATSVPVQLGTEISLNISVTPNPPGQVYLSHF